MTIIERNTQGQNTARDLTGRQFGRLHVLEPTDQRRNGYVVWRARCECGTVIERPSYRFIRGLKSCGCGPVGRPRIPNNGAHVNAMVSHYRRGASNRGIGFHLTPEQARRLFEAPCHYCGAPPSVSVTHDNLSGEYAWNGIDRVDPAGDYTAENTVPACKHCNWAKGAMSLTEFRAWVQRVHSHLF